MILIFFYVLVLFSCLPLIKADTDTNNSMPICPESFSCSGIDAYTYPFYKAPDTGCGLIEVNCTSDGGEIQIGGRPYNITAELDFDRQSNDGYFNIIIHNETFGRLVKNNSCEALMNTFTFPSPSPLLYSISIYSTITLFKCKKNVTHPQRTDAYFQQHGYKSHNTCNDYNFYYNYKNQTVPTYLPHTCQVVQLPLIQSIQWGFNESNIFSLLTHLPLILFKLSPSCDKCYRKGDRCAAKNEHDVQCSGAIRDAGKKFCMECQKNGRHCDEKNGHVQCVDVKTDIYSPKQTDPEKQSGDRNRMIKMLVIISGSTLILVVFFVIFIIWCRRKSNPFSYVSSKKKSLNFDDISLSCGVAFFSYKELEDATQNFDPANELGDGGFGAVYYGKLEDGREIAVKKLHEHNYNRVQHFRNEVEILTKLRHPNLVVLYGCTSRQSRELLLVYEYVPNGTVADHLHGKQENPTLLTWPIRLNIAIETASALAYLHASEIIHRDVKTNNILLDHNFGVKVADFGLSRLIPNNVTHVSTAPQGTPGYVDPEYHQRYQLTDKSDVYSFGVVLIELISSLVVVDLNRSQDEISLANLALNKIHGRAIDELIDPVLRSDMSPETMNMITSVAELAFQCLQYHSEMRPTMNEVLDVLIDIQAYDNTSDSQTEKVSFSETNDSVVLLKDLRPSPISVTSEWQSNNSAPTKLSSNGDKLSMKNSISI